MMKCDPITGACLLPDMNKAVDSTAPAPGHGWVVHYADDPMCSWCWGISPTVDAVEPFRAVESSKFSITMGGLRAQASEDVVAFASFLAEPDSDYMTGQTPLIDGRLIHR